VKWPNDVLCDGAKVSGILLEGEGVGRLAVALGVGVNCVRHPANTEFPATDLGEAGVHVPAENLFRVLSRTMLARVTQWQRGFNFAAIRGAWLARTDGLGKPLRVRLQEREITGIFETLDERGRLILRRDDGLHEVVTAGDVFPIGSNHADHS
jgi:BirA family biotin operon repressor/biotin-[acetyl-CoA-carboxylase] ligase